jgi:hypothetical protein
MPAGTDGAPRWFRQARGHSPPYFDSPLFPWHPRTFPTLHPWIFSQGIEQPVHGRSSPAHRTSPAVAPFGIWKQLRKVTTHPSPPHLPASCRDDAVDQEPPEVRRRSTRATSPDLARRNPNLTVSLTLTFISNRRISIQWSIIDHLSEQVSSDLHRTDHFKSNGPETRSTRKGTVQSEIATWPVCVQTDFQIDFWIWI